MTFRPPLVGITCGTSSVEGETPRYGTNQAYVRAIAAAGGIPVLLVPGSAGRAGKVIDRLGGLLLPGGADVDPALYGAVPSSTVERVDKARDEVELDLVSAARHVGVPIFGICRGMQVINVAFGGTLYQDIPTERAGALRHATPRVLGRAHLEHDVQVAPGSWLAETAGATELMVNSLHHQAVREVGEGLIVTATSEDGLVEGLETADRGTVCVQCHPEELQDLAWARDLFRSFVASAAG